MAPTKDDHSSSLSSTEKQSGESPLSDAPARSIDDSRVIQDVQAFREALQRGETPDREKLLAKYPAIAQELSACLDGLEFVQGAAPQFRDGNPGSARGTPPDEAFPPHALLGDYRIVREIGRGGMGVVYEAEQVSLARRVALKVLPFAAVMDARQIGRFKNEALAAAQLDHPHIVNVHAVGCERGVHFYAMRYVDGRPLSAVIDEHRQSAAAPAEKGAADTAAMAGHSTQVSPDGPAYFRMVAEIGRQVADALDHAHRHGVVHRDVKPSNLLLDGEGRAWVADFGLARMGPDANLTMTGDLVGTLRYMSPEQLRGERAVVDHRTDIYSLGLTLYELLTQRPAFEGNDRQEILRQIAAVDPPPPRRWSRAIPVELETIVLKATAKEAAERYATAQELADDLQRYLDDVPVTARRASVVSRARKWGRRHKAAVRTAFACSLFAIAMAAGSIGWTIRNSAARQHELERETDRVLRDALFLLDQGDWPKAKALVENAEHVMVPYVPAVTRHRMEALQYDLAMAARFEEIRLRPPEGSNFANQVARYGEVNPIYREAFRQYGIDIPSVDKESAAQRIRTSPIRNILVAALDDWYWAKLNEDLAGKLIHASLYTRSGRPPPRVSPFAEDKQSEQLREIANAADAHQASQRIRNALGNNDRQALIDLAADAEQQKLPAMSLLLLGRALRRNAEPERAIQLLLAAQRRMPSDLAINVELAWLLQSAKRPEEGAGFLRIAVAVRPDSAKLHQALGLVLHSAKQYDQAIEALKRSVELEPGYFGVHLYLGQAFAAKGNWMEAISAHSEALRLSQIEQDTKRKPTASSYVPHVPAALLYRGGCYRHAGLLDDATADYSKAIEIDVNCTSAWRSRSECRMRKGEWYKAAQDAAQALKLKPDESEHHFVFAACLLLSGDNDGYRKACEEALRRFAGVEGDGFPPYIAARACVLAADGVALPPELRSRAERIAVTSGGGGWAHLCARELCRAQQYQDARAALAAALKQHPIWDNTTCLNSLLLALVHYRLGNTDEAQQWFANVQERLRKGEQEKGTADTFPVHIANWLSCQVLLREVETALNEQPIPEKHEPAKESKPPEPRTLKPEP